MAKKFLKYPKNTPLFPVSAENGSSPDFRLSEYLSTEMQTKQPNPTEIQIDGSTEPYLRPRDLAKLLDVKEKTFGDWFRRYPDFPAIQLPGSIRIRASELKKWLDQLTTEAKEHHTGGKEVS
jgi:hypothetical protein